MSFKKWLSIFLTSFFIVIGGTCLVNFIFNPDGFFRPKYWPEPDFTSIYLLRKSKPSYIATNAEKFSCVIIGGSNAGFLRTKTVQELTGQACFNSYVTNGFFGDYLCLVDFYSKTMPNLNEIILNISNNEIEVKRNTKEQLYTAMPIYLCKKFELHPFLKSLLKIPSVKYFMKETPQRHEFDNTESGEEPYDDVYDEEQMQKSILQDGVFHQVITYLCTSEKRDFPYLKQSLIELQEIKNICDSYGIKLTVMMGAVFISKKALFESNEFYDWLREISKITEFYDFSGFNEINLNPYNFFDTYHFNKKVGDKMLRIIYGAEEIQNFGEKITSENIESYLEWRRTEYEKIKDEFRRTGTIRLFDKSHPSYVE